MSPDYTKNQRLSLTPGNVAASNEKLHPCMAHTVGEGCQEDLCGGYWSAKNVFSFTRMDKGEIGSTVISDMPNTPPPLAC